MVEGQHEEPSRSEQHSDVHRIARHQRPADSSHQPPENTHWHLIMMIFYRLNCLPTYAGFKSAARWGKKYRFCSNIVILLTTHPPFFLFFSEQWLTALSMHLKRHLFLMQIILKHRKWSVNIL